MSDSLESQINCVECGFTYEDCICNIEDELREDDGDEFNEF
jgi:hypothetical protein